MLEEAGFANSDERDLSNNLELCIRSDLDTTIDYRSLLLETFRMAKRE
jgi:hypothetical protein